MKRWIVPLLVGLVIVLPILEVWLLIRVGHWIGVLPTIGLLVLMVVAGFWLAQHEGLRSWRAITEAAARGEVPTRQVTDGALVLVGGLLLLLPGFLTDIVGLVFLLPFTRSIPRAVVTRAIGSRSSRIRRDATIIEGEVVRDDDTTPGPALEGRVID